MQFAEAHFFFFVEVDRGADDGEEGVAVSFEFGALVASSGVFDGKFVQVEGFLQAVQFVDSGVGVSEGYGGVG